MLPSRLSGCRLEPVLWLPSMGARGIRSAFARLFDLCGAVSCRSLHCAAVFMLIAAPSGNHVGQNEAHRQWQEAGQKLRLLQEDPEQYFERYGQLSMPD